MHARWLTRGLLFLSLILIHPDGAKTTSLCHGFLPDNNLRVPVSIRQNGGISRAEYDAILDRIEKVYAPIVQAHGGNLEVHRLWDVETVNAAANRYGTRWLIRMFGGMARYPVMTKDGYAMVACHEMGHHLGGAPRKIIWSGPDWMSNEGEADYYAMLRCLRLVWPEEENAAFVNSTPIDPLLKSKCESTFASIAEQNLCAREGMAGLDGALVFRSLDKTILAPTFATPDPSEVIETVDIHPVSQCRLDTYLAGATCLHDTNVELSWTDPAIGTCSNRPRCWFKPALELLPNKFRVN